MIEFYYTLLMIGIFSGMLLYSRSMAVSIFSLYTATWFFPQGIPLTAIPIGLNSIIAFVELIYIAFAFHKTSIENQQLCKNVCIYILSVLALFLVVALMSNQVPFGKQMTEIKNTLYFSFNFLIVLFFNRKNDFSVYFQFVGLLIIVSGIYAVYTYIIGQNPFGEYIALYMTNFADQGLGTDFLEEERGFLSGRVSGFTVHPLMFGGVIALFTYIYSFYLSLLKGKIVRLFLLFFIIFCFILLLLTGSRSILIGFVIGLVSFLFKTYRKIFVLLFFIAFFGFIVGGFVIEDEFIRATFFFWEDHDEVNGSSSSMRLDQFNACVDEVSKDIISWIFGLGHTWSGIYLSKHGNLPPFQGFESILFTKIVNNGVIGTMLYFLFVFLPIFRFLKRYVQPRSFIFFIEGFLITNLTIAFFTGEYYGYRLFLVTTFLLIKFNIVLYQRSGIKDYQFQARV